MRVFVWFIRAAIFFTLFAFALNNQQEAMQRLSASNERETAGTTSLGALLRAKLDNKGDSNG